MHTHVAEIMPEARLHEGACCGVQWLAGGAQDIMHNRPHIGRRGTATRGTLRAHHRVRHAIGLVLVLVIGRADF